MTLAREVVKVVLLILGILLRGFLAGVGFLVLLQIFAWLYGGTFLLCFGKGCPSAGAVKSDRGVSEIFLAPDAQT